VEGLLKMAKMEEFIQDCRELIGKEAVDVQPGRTVATWLNIRQILAGALGDKNPLYNDGFYAMKQRYGCLLAHPSFLLCVRTPMSNGPLSTKNYNLIPFQTEIELEWFDVIRIMYRFRSELTLYNTSEKSGTYFVKQKKIAVLSSDVWYWNHHGELAGKGRGSVAMIPASIGKEMLIDRDIYEYSDDEIKQITNDLDNLLPARGIRHLYWNEVEVGHELPQLVKVLYHDELVSWLSAEGQMKSTLVGESVFRDLKQRPGDVRTNPVTNWPYWDAHQNNEDFFGCKLSGMPAPFARGTQITALLTQAVTNWMSDESFLNKLTVKITKPYLYGDTLWIRGSVIDKYKEKIEGEMYRAVEITLGGTNQLNETVASATAKVYLSDLGYPVSLPLPS
jgi:acyl dehydratase